MSPNSPFTLITEPTAVQRILLAEGLTDVATEIPGNGFVFVPIESPDQWGLVITHKNRNGEVSHRVATCNKEAGPRRMARAWAWLIDDLSHKIGCPVCVKVQEQNLN